MILSSDRVRFTNRITKRRNENGEKFINEYKVLRTLGKGSVGSVKLCEKRSPEYSTESNVVENEALTVSKIFFSILQTSKRFTLSRTHYLLNSRSRRIQI
mmetsp:Transcript_75/g.104  ORF Transcript_75/g.104 Transcript_75/m.104 type:complete len:100 (-) Transcript_75:1496-1795(-)